MDRNLRDESCGTPVKDGRFVIGGLGGVPDDIFAGVREMMMVVGDTEGIEGSKDVR